MKILILGGHGFVGRHVKDVLNSRGNHEVKALSRRDGMDMTNLESARKNLQEPGLEIIINCAAHTGSLHYVTEYTADVVNDNMQIALNLYKAVKEVCPRVKIINPLSNCSYPGDSSIQRESEYWNGRVHNSVCSYGNSRRMLCVISECYFTQESINSVNFLIPNSYGPGDSTDPNRTHALNGMIIRMLKARDKGESEFEIWGSGKPIREWVFVKDVARILADAINIDNQIAPVNLAQNKAYSIAKTAEMIKESIGYFGRLKFNTKYADGAPIKQLDDALFRNKFPCFRFTSIREGIEETVRYYEKVLGEEK